MKKFFIFVKKHKVSLVLFAITLLIMARIFSFSAEASDQSQETSESVAYFIAALIIRGFSSLPESEQLLEIDALVPVIRKIAHFVIYMALGFVAFSTQNAFLLENKQRALFLRCGAVTAVFSLLYAATDEIHQLFVDGRSGSVRDVLLDFCGAVCGILTAFLLLALFLKMRKKRQGKSLQKVI